MRQSKYQQFIFKDYQFDEKAKTLKLRYAMDDALEFVETFTFNFDFVQYDHQVLDRALQNLFFMAGVSYFKTYVPPAIVVKKGTLDQAAADFFSKTYQRGLGEFWYVNQLDPNTLVKFPVNATNSQFFTSEGEGLLVGVGGGKDSLVSIELLRRNQQNISTWSVGHELQLAPLIKRIDLPHYQVERTWDAQLQSLNQQDALNGHVPISAIFACVGTVVAVLAGKRDVVVSNENSANEPTLIYQDVAINHQYSKSIEFEIDFQTHLSRNFGDSIRYYSLLRPLSEVRIAELFARVGFDTYKDVFSSCNRAFTRNSDRMFWCGACPKCAFVFLALTPFVDKTALETLFHGKNLLLNPSMKPMYRQLLGIEGDKPLECVGEIKESRAAMRIAQQIYPEHTQYQFDLPDSYDYQALAAHRMPEELFTTIKSDLTA